MSDSPEMSIPKFKYKLRTCKIKSSKLSSLIDSFRPLWLYAFMCRNEFLRILKR